MRALRPTPPASARHGFTVIELMLSVAIMTMIVIGLYTVFDATQKALRNTMSQVDVLEGIRSATDLIVRDVEAAVPVELANTNLTSLAASVNPASVAVSLQGLDPARGPLFVTSLQDIFFVTRQNDTWTAIGYWIGPSDTNRLGQPISAGRLYRFAFATNNAAFGYTNLLTRFNSPQRLLSSQPVMDGVVHLRLQAYNSDGLPLVFGRGDAPRYTSLSPWFRDPNRNTETAYWFRRINVPAFPTALEFELAVLEPQVLTRFASIPLADEARKFLARHAGNVHLFRQRIPLRNAPLY